MSKTRNSNSRSAAATVEKTTGVQQDDVGTTSTTSDPSGLRAPDGTHTGPADEAVSADLKNSEGHDQEVDALIEAATIGALEIASSNIASADTVSNLLASAGAESVPHLLALANLGKTVFVVTGTVDIEHLTRVANIGKHTLSIIEEVSATYPQYQKWIGDENPAEIIAELAMELDYLRASLNKVSLITSSSTDAATVIEHLESGDRHPLTKALFEDWDQSRSPVFRITSKEAGFFRGGIRHPAEATDYSIEEISPDQLETILGEPLLTVELV